MFIVSKRSYRLLDAPGRALVYDGCYHWVIDDDSRKKPRTKLYVIGSNEQLSEEETAIIRSIAKTIGFRDDKIAYIVDPLNVPFYDDAKLVITKRFRGDALFNVYRLDNIQGGNKHEKA